MGNQWVKFNKMLADGMTCDKIWIELGIGLESLCCRKTLRQSIDLSQKFLYYSQEHMKTVDSTIPYDVLLKLQQKWDSETMASIPSTAKSSTTTAKSLASSLPLSNTTKLDVKCINVSSEVANNEPTNVNKSSSTCIKKNKTSQGRKRKVQIPSIFESTQPQPDKTGEREPVIQDSNESNSLIV